MQELQKYINDWQKETFLESTVDGAMNHLEREFEEFR
jgi:hypothetical protein